MGTTAPQPGTIIRYHLPLAKRPTDPNRLWKGRVIKWFGNTFLLVELLEPGYQDLTEIIHIDQIKAVEEQEHF